MDPPPPLAFTYFQPVYVVETQQVEEAAEFYINLFKADKVVQQPSIVDGIVYRQFDLTLSGTRSTIVVTNAGGKSGTNYAIVHTLDVRAAVDRAVALGATQVGGSQGIIVDKFGFTWLFSSTAEKSCTQCYRPRHFPTLCSECQTWTNLGKDDESPAYTQARTVDTSWLTSDRVLKQLQLKFEEEKCESFYAHENLFHTINHMYRLSSMIRWVGVFLYVRPGHGQYTSSVKDAVHRATQTFGRIRATLPSPNVDPRSWPVLRAERQLILREGLNLLKNMTLARHMIGENLSDEQVAWNEELTKEWEFWKFLAINK